MKKRYIIQSLVDKTYFSGFEGSMKNSTFSESISGANFYHSINKAEEIILEMKDAYCYDYLIILTIY